jgi:hypothetical protein
MTATPSTPAQVKQHRQEREAKRATLPRYMVERKGEQWAIWDTVEHEYTGFEFTDKQQAVAKAHDFNTRSTPLL